MTFQIFFMYIIVFSLCLMYEINFYKIQDMQTKPKILSFAWIKMLIIISILICLLSALLHFVLLPYNFEFIFPVVLILLLVAISVGVDYIPVKILKPQKNNFWLSFFSVFIAVSEGTNIFTALLIGISSICFYYFLLFVIYCIDKKNNSVMQTSMYNTIALMLIAMSCIIFAAYSSDISWLSIRYFY